jgi:Host cell surface-exposed lipoprotein/PASTA domain
MTHNVGRIVTAAVLVVGLLSACAGSPGEATIAAAPTSSSSVLASTASSSAPTSAAAKVKGPSVTGLSIEQATAAIESAGLTITISGDTSNPAYGIVSQTPDAASEVAESSVVTVNVGESAPQKKEREDAAAVAQAAADEAARVEAERVAAEQAASAAASAAAAAAAAGTVSQQNALRSARNYLSFTSFSRTGLIEQLEFEDFSTEDAAWAVDRVTVDWNEQAAKSAKNYLEFTSFSHSGLVEQLIYGGFTPEQAEYGVSETGL